jgi:hypothetical protein
MPDADQSAVPTPVVVIATVNPSVYRGQDDVDGFVVRLAGSPLPRDAAPVAVLAADGTVTILDGVTELTGRALNRARTFLAQEMNGEASELFWLIHHVNQDPSRMYDHTRQLNRMIVTLAGVSLADQVVHWGGRDGLHGRIYAAVTGGADDSRLPAWAQLLVRKTRGVLTG